ncbi:MAG: hypothetical protein K2P81_12645 [Bacteriovoracaceae bacterium]|nr:hypothetical protein [Bacteriovoracaceae bacterium]
MSPFRITPAQSKIEFSHFLASGSDACEFIQGQSTQKLTESWSIHSFLDRSGKIECYFIAWKNNQDVTILLNEKLKENLKLRFEKFVISEDVTLNELTGSDWWIASGGHDDLEGHIGNLGGQKAWLSQTAQIDVPHRAAAELESYLSWQGLPSLSASQDVGVIINQTRLFDSAVDLKKGCFPGQEVVAKIYHNRGAAWYPVLLEKISSAEQADVIEIDGQIIAKLKKNQDEQFIQAEILRDFRVEGIEISGRYRVKFYPRWSTSKSEIAKELYHRGVDLFAKGDEDEALKLWKNSIQFDPAFFDSYEAIGVLLGRQNKYPEAEGWMRKLLEVDPTSVMAHTNLSLFLMKMDRIQEAEDHKSKATVAQFAVFGKKSQTEKEMKEKQRREIEKQNEREAMFLQVLEIDSEDSLANFGLGSLCIERGEFSKAKDYLENVIRCDPNYAVAYLALGKAFVGLGFKDQAKEIWSRGVKIAAKKGELMPANEMQSLINSNK